MGEVCTKCGFEDVDGAQRCGNCGYNSPKEHRKGAGLVMILGLILTPALIGLFILGYGFAKYEDADGRTIAETA
jgi:ribosomal protein L40E